MQSFQVHRQETAPAASRALLAQVQEAFGFVPNLAGTLAEAPAALEAFLALDHAFSATSLTPTERQVVLLATSFANECDYCMAAHTVIAGMQKLSGEVVGALRYGRSIADAKLEALRSFTNSVVTARGRVSDAEVQRFLAAGYTRSHVLEVITGVTVKTLTNYVNYVAQTPLDAQFRSGAWTAAGSRDLAGSAR
jgi:uncharacterized peroxidase-related enzyme